MAPELTATGLVCRPLLWRVGRGEPLGAPLRVHVPASTARSAASVTPPSQHEALPNGGQSPFTIIRGNAFEQRVFHNGMTELIALVREHLGHETPHTRWLRFLSPLLSYT